MNKKISALTSADALGTDSFPIIRGNANFKVTIASLLELITAGATFVTPLQYGAKGDGIDDDAVALQAALDTGSLVWLSPYTTYAFGAQLTIPSNGGFVGGGNLLMLTDTGKFDFSTYDGGLGSGGISRAGIYLNGKSNVKIEAKISMQANTAVRTCYPLRIDNCSHVDLDVEITGFKEMQNAAVEWNTNVGGTVRLNIHDIYTNSTSFAVQLTGLSVDNNRIGGVNSTGLRFDVRAKDIHQGSESIAAYGYQSDAVSLKGEGLYGGHTGQIVSDNVAEALDIWSHGNVVNVVARNGYHVVKVIYGASYNVINATVDLYHKAALYLSGGNAAMATAYNQITITASRGGEVGSQGDVCGVLIEGGADLAPDHNTVNASVKGDGVNLDYGVMISTGAINNTVNIDAAGASQGAARIVSTAGAGNKINRAVPTFVRANLSANQTYADLATVICDTETKDTNDEYNPATGVWTCKVAGRYRFHLKASMSVAAGAGYGSYIWVNGVEGSRKRDTNTGTAGATLGHDHIAIFDLAEGQTVYFRNDGPGTTTWFGGSGSTYIEIEEV